MGVLVSSKVVTTTTNPIKCDDIATITLNLNASKSITANPVDIMLVLDKSASMSTGGKLSALKTSANKFIDIIDESTNNGTPTGTISGGSRIGIVTFEGTATFVNPPGLSTNVSDLKTVINNLTTTDSTCHGCAFKIARESFDPASTNKKILVMITDGFTTVFTYDPDIESATTKAAGIEIYCIGLGTPPGDIDVDALKRWATDDAHVLIAPDASELEQAFEDLAQNIIKPGATGIVIEDFIYDDFQIIGTPTISFSGNPTPTPTTSATIAPDKKSIKWEISALGVNGDESATLVFNVQHVSCVGGDKLVNKNTTYVDNEGNIATFPNQNNIVKVNCIEDIPTNCCNPPETITFPACTDYKEATLPLSGAYGLTCVGRLLNLHVKLQNVCPNRKIAVGVIVYELVNGKLQSRGFKAVTITTPPPSSNPNCLCKTVDVGPFEFILPETSSICSTREFKARVIAHYADSLQGYNFTCS